jgi:hypothetical protein
MIIHKEHFLRVAFVVLATSVLCSCTVWHRNVVSPPPQYTVYPALSLMSRLATTNWTSIDGRPKSNVQLVPVDTPVASNIQDWVSIYTDSTNRTACWVPQPDLLAQTLTNALAEYGVPATNQFVTTLTNLAFAVLCTPTGHFHAAYCHPTASADAHAYLQSKLDGMFRLADEENKELLTNDYAVVQRLASSCRSDLPWLTSRDLPVGVSVSSSWEENPSSTPAASASDGSNSNTEKVVLDKIQVTFEAASTNSTSSKSTTNNAASDSTPPDYQEDQKVTLSMSTVLNSASVLDRIDYVTTYLYLLPYPLTPNGHVVLEREFWNKLLETISVRDPLVRTNAGLLHADIQSCIYDMRVRAHDISTTVDVSQVNLGTVVQSSGSTINLGLSATAKGSPFLPSISPQASYAGTLNGSDTLTLSRQLDQRSTYIDKASDFIRITQRGMQSVNLAGRIKEILTLHVPRASEPIYCLCPSKTNLCTFCVLSQPLYSQVNALTFSVTAARQTTKLAATIEDRYGLDDRNDAAFIVGVTPLEHIKVWQWERTFDEINTWDLCGKDGKTAKSLFFTTFTNETPHPLRLLNFDTAQRNKLLNEIRVRAANATNHIAVLTNEVDALGGGILRIGCVDDDDNPQQLSQICASKQN